MTDVILKPVRPPRTIGLSLAILLSVFMFTVVPLVQGGVLVLLQYRAASVRLSDDRGTSVIAAGGTFGSANGVVLNLQILLGVIFLLPAIFAWCGRPASIRSIMIVSVCVLALLYVWDSFTGLFAPQQVTSGIDSATGLRSMLQCARLLGNILVPMYVLWYLNRGPARAFYRGYYLPSPPEPPDEAA